MHKNLKLNIYQGIIQYLLDNTDYTLKRIASFSNCSIKTIRAIYNYNEIPIDFSSDLHLVRLFQIILELEEKYGKQKSYLSLRSTFGCSGFPDKCNEARYL